jgi:hypothetical protein
MPTELEGVDVSSPEMAGRLARLRTTLVVASLLTVAASLLLARLYFVHLPLGVDGGWYSYPAYAWSMGGDPAENSLDVATTPGEAGRPVAKFQWLNRTNLTVPFTAGWLAWLGPSWQSLRWLGVAQLAAVLVLAAVAIGMVARQRLFVGLGVLAVLADSRLLSIAVSDARPDITVSIVALMLLISIVRAVRTGSRLAAGTSALLCVALPLVHVTSSNVIALLAGFICAWALLERDASPRGVWLIWPLAAIALMGLGFLLREPILDWLVPTSVPPAIEGAFRQDLGDKLRGMLEAGARAKLGMEAQRWREYFLIGNAAQLAVLAVGLAAAAWAWRRRPPTPESSIAIALMAGLVVAALAMLLTNPHRTVYHLLPLAVLGYVGAVGSLEAALGEADAHAIPTVRLAIGLVGLMLVLKLAQIAGVVRTFARPGISNAAIEAMLAHELGRARVSQIVGPAELWPYLTHTRRNILILDRDRAYVPQLPDHADFRTASHLVINADYAAHGWAGAVARWRAQGLIEPVAALGYCGATPACLEIYRLVPGREWRP